MGEYPDDGSDGLPGQAATIGDEPGGAPRRQPWLHEMSVVVDGNITACSAADGQITTPPGRPGAQGVFVDDRRVLSVLSIRLDDQAPTAIAGRAAGAGASFLAAARNLGDAGADPTVEVRRSRELSRSGLREVVRLTSRAAAPLRTTLSLQACGDGEDIAAVKAGLPARHPLPATWSAQQELVWGDGRHRSTLQFSTQPDAVLPGSEDEPSVARFAVCLEPSTSWELEIDLRVERTSASTLDAGQGSSRAQWADLRCESDDPRLAPALHTNLQDLRRLLLTDPERPSDVFAAAGTPWYLTLFGRDSIWAASMMLPFGTDLAGGTLRALARRQGTTNDEASAQQPGKIPHEVRRSVYAGAAAREVLVLPEVYYGTVDATALWITLLHDAWSWGLPQEQVAQLGDALVGAARWLVDCCAADPDGLLRYLDGSGSGLANQGWKDSGDSIRWRDGSIAEGPIALVEAQAYAIEAATKGARLMDLLGVGDAAALSQWGDELRQRVRDRFWVNGPDGEYLGLAVDGHGQLVDGLASNMGHVLGTGTLRAKESADIARVLTQPRMLGRYGVGTLASDNGGFNPIGYHTGSVWTHDTAICARGLRRDGHPQEAAAVGRALLASAEAFGYRWPELYAGAAVLDQPAPYPAACRPQAWSAASAAVLVDLALGFEPDAAGSRLVLRPMRPAPFGAFRLEGLRFGAERFGVDCAADGTVRLIDAPRAVRVEMAYVETARAGAEAYPRAGRAGDAVAAAARPMLA